MSYPLFFDTCIYEIKNFIWPLKTNPLFHLISLL